MIRQGLSEQIVQEVVGCGPFQVLIVISLCVVSKAAATYSMMMMSFGNYNPGWRCLDANDTIITTTTTRNNNTSSYDHSGEVYTKDNCSLFESCKNVQFSPEASTIVSEWGLLCDKAWIPSLIISIQMAGVLVGGCVSGYLADRFGRKKVYFGGQFVLLTFNVISVFSTSWEMFAVCRFFLGTAIALVFALYFVYAGEFIPMKWRAPVAGAPFWATTCITFVLFCMLLKDWKYVHVVTAVISIIGIIPAIWTPESLRWLEAKNRIENYEKTVRQMVKMNSKELPAIYQGLSLNSVEDGDCEETKIYNILHIFKGRYRILTFLLILPWLAVSLIFYAISFGIKSLSGNFYVNLIASQAMEVPFTFTTMYAPNLFGRRNAGSIYSISCGLFLVTAAFLQDYTTGNVQIFGVLACVTLGKLFINGFWSIIILHTTELYPTVLRGLGISWGNVMARVGGILAPFLIPNKQDAFFVCYIIMSVLAIVVGLIITRLRETKGKELENDFEPNKA